MLNGIFSVFSLFFVLAAIAGDDAINHHITFKRQEKLARDAGIPLQYTVELPQLCDKLVFSHQLSIDKRTILFEHIYEQFYIPNVGRALIAHLKSNDGIRIDSKKYSDILIDRCARYDALTSSPYHARTGAQLLRSACHEIMQANGYSVSSIEV